MKKENKVIRFDYSKYKDDSWDDESLFDYQFWGLHPKHGRMHIDTKRYKYIINKVVGETEFTPAGLFKIRNSVYYTPSKIHRYDYIINIFRDLLKNLENDWQQEYKILFNAIKTPNQVKNEYRTHEMMFTSDPDDLDEIDIDATFASIRRENKYNQVINSLYCQFVLKITTEVNRIIIVGLKEKGYKDDDFSYSQFVSFSDGILGDKKGISIKNLREFNSYNKLNKIADFIRHNTKIAYDRLNKYCPDSVYVSNDKSDNQQYENGMYAGNWIKFEKNYIDNLFDKLKIFFEDYCTKFLKENVDAAKWDYDDFFITAFHQLKRPRTYLGIPY